MKMHVWYPILASISLGFLFMNIPPVSGQFMTLFGVGYDGLSFLLSGLFWTHALTQVPSGLVVDGLGPWRSLVAALGLGVLANLLPFLAPHNLAWAFALRIAAGLCTSVAFLAVIKIVAVLSPPTLLARIQGLQGAGFCFGTMMPYLTLPHLGPEAWRYSYIIGAGFLTLVLVLAFFLPRQTLTAKPDDRTNNLAEVGLAVKTVLSSKYIWIIGIFHGMSYGSLTNMGQWLPSILADLDGLGQPLLWAPATMLMLFTGTMSRAFAGELPRWFAKPAIVDRAVLIVALLYLVLAVIKAPWLVITASVTMALACGSTYGSIFTMTGASVRAAYVATAIGLMNMIANLFNVLLTLVFGYVREYTQSFSPALIATGIFGLLAWFLLHRHLYHPKGR